MVQSRASRPFRAPTLRRIPEARRSAITVLYQATRDRRVLAFCGKLGFATVELVEGRPFRLSRSFALTVWRSGLRDSYGLIESSDARVLNLNDCIVDSAARAARVALRTGRVDVLLTQFGYAQWIGNEGDGAARARAAQEKLQRIRLQVEALQPAVVVPFASFVYFSHVENFYLNDHMMPVGAVKRFLDDRGVRSVVLYPGDRWAVGEPFDDASGLERYADSASSIAPVHTTATVERAVLVAAWQRYASRIRERYGRLPAFLEALGLIRPITLTVRDRDETWRLSYRTEPLVGEGRHEGGDTVQLWSESLKFILENDFGIDTVAVNGRFRTSPSGAIALQRFFALSLLSASGYSLVTAVPFLVARFVLNSPAMGSWWRLRLWLRRRGASWRTGSREPGQQVRAG